MAENQNVNNIKVKRLSEREMAMRRTTLQLHSFLTSDELSLYYILDRLPVRNRFGIGDRSEVAVIQKIMGCGADETEKAVDGLVRMGLIQPPGTDTTWMESIINFPSVFEFCTRLGQHPLGFGRFLREVTGYMHIDEIGPREYGLAESAYRSSSVNAHAHVYGSADVDMDNGVVAEHFMKT